jgi:hypothetical protein
MKKGLYFLMTFGIAALVITMILFPVVGAIAGGSTLAVISTGTITSLGIDTAAPNHLERDISKFITKERPDEFPLSTFIDSIRKPYKVHAEKVEYETLVYRGRETANNGLYTGVNSQNAALTVDDGTIFAVDDHVRFPSVNGADSLPLVCKVVAVSGNTVNVTALNGGGASGQEVPTIADDAVMNRLGNGKTETASQTGIITSLPTQAFNYCGIEMALLEQSKVAAQRRAYSGLTYNDKWNMEIYNFKTSREANGLYGVKKKSLDPVTGDYTYHADGITRMITQSIEYGPGSSVRTISLADIASMLELGFAANAGSEKRLLLCGKGVITALSQITLNREIGTMESQTVHGVKVNTLHSHFGDVYIKHSKTLDANGDANSAYLIDMGYVFKHTLEPMKIEKLDPDSAGIRRVQNSLRIIENSCFTATYGATHLKWELKTT